MIQRFLQAETTVSELTVWLFQTGVPCELVVAPRAGYGFCIVDYPLTNWVHKGICGSMRQEFGMELSEF